MSRTTDSPRQSVPSSTTASAAAVTDQGGAIVRQAAPIAELAERLDFNVIGIYTDIGVPRSTPWYTRPTASRLTAVPVHRPVAGDAVLANDKHHAIGPNHLATAPPIAMCRPGTDRVIADRAIDAILTGFARQDSVLPKPHSRTYMARHARGR